MKKNELAETQDEKKLSINAYMNNKGVQKSIVNMVGEAEKTRFIASVVSAVNTNPTLAECSNNSILNAALLGESLKLPPSPQLGFFYMVPYNGKNGKEAQFQIGYKGYLQLAIRSGEYKKILASEIKEGELKKYDPIFEEYEFLTIHDVGLRESLKTIGYFGMIELVNGYRKEMFWTREKMESHAKKYSFAYRKGYDTLWKTNFDTMAKKTIIRQLISKYGIMSTEMKRAYISDMGVIGEDGSVDYVDNMQLSTEEIVAEEISEKANQKEFVVDAEVVEGDTIPFE